VRAAQGRWQRGQFAVEGSKAGTPDGVMEIT